MVFLGLFGKNKENYVVYNVGDVVYYFNYFKKEPTDINIRITADLEVKKPAFRYINDMNEKVIATDDIIEDDIENVAERNNIIKISYCKRNIEKLNDKIEEMNKEIKDIKSHQKVDECKLINAEHFSINNNLRYTIDNTISDTLKNYDIVYVLTGEYPNYSISEKKKMVEDDFNYCLKEKDTNNISLWSKDKCFKTYEEANNKVLELIQKETNKEHPCQCKCTSKKK